MKFTEKTFQLFGCVVLALFIAACSQAPKPADSTPADSKSADPKPGTPEAAAAGERLMRSMSDTLAQAKTFTFETSERFDVSPTGGEKKVLHFTRKVTVRRPNGLFFEIHGQGDTALDLAAYYDGRTLTLNQKAEGPSEVGTDDCSRYARRDAGRRRPEVRSAGADRRCGLQLALRRLHRQHYEGRTRGTGDDRRRGVREARLRRRLRAGDTLAAGYRAGAAPPAYARLQKISDPVNRGANFH